MRTLRRKIVVYAVFYTLAALLVVSFFSILPLLHSLKESATADLIHDARVKAQTVEEHLHHLRALARQVASRTPLRDALALYHLGEMAPGDLKHLSDRHLADALAYSEEMLGILRLDAQGRIVGQAGRALPQTLWPSPSLTQQEVHLTDPVVLDTTLHLVGVSPLHDRGGARIGTDLVLFSVSTLQKIVWEEGTLEEGADSFLGQAVGERAEIFFPGRLGEREIYNTASGYPLYRQALQLAAEGQAGILQRRAEGEAPDMVAYAPVEGTHWGLLVTMDQALLFARTNRLLIFVAGIVVFFTLCGGAGIFLLLRPLTRQVWRHASELQELNRGLQQEIAERRRAEDRLRRSESEWSQTFEAITDAVAILDTQGRVLKMNQANLSFLSSLSEDVLSQKRCRVHYGMEETGKLCPFTRMLRSGAPEHGELYEPKTQRHFNISIYPLRTEEGEIWGGVHIAQDITEQKKMENLKDEMISSVSHEMRTPLTAMLGFVEYLLENEVDPEQQREFLRTVHRETERLNDLISNFLDLQRLQAQLETYHFENVPVCPLLQEVVQLFSVSSRRHQIQLNCPRELPPLKADPKRLLQVLNNLLSNAIRYSPEGGAIEVGARAEGKMVRIWVRDEGLGIPPQALNKIFNRFYRVDDSARRIPGGIGLGLALVREVLRAHGGKVWVDSTVGRGSTFFILLPCAHSENPE